MNSLVMQYVQSVKDRIGKQSRVLEIGSLDVNGSVRPIFSDANEYIGIDPIKGRGVDIVASSYQIPKLFKKESFDCVICCETLEHDPFFWITIRNMRWVLKKGGWLIVSAPSLRQKVHQYPKDYYRFLPDAFDLVIFKGFEECEGVVGFPASLKKPSPEKHLLTIAYSGRKPMKFREMLPR